jgi:hypothetical protein
MAKPQYDMPLVFIYFLSLESLAPTHKSHIFRTTLICVCVCVCVCVCSSLLWLFVFFIGPGGPGAPHKLHIFFVLCNSFGHV